jgi:hypothetical protein
MSCTSPPYGSNSRDQSLSRNLSDSENSPSYPLTLTLSPKGEREQEPQAFIFLWFSNQESKALKKKIDPFLFSPPPTGGED